MSGGVDRMEERELAVRGKNLRKQGLYDPTFEHDSCGVGFLVDIQGRKSHAIVQKSIEILINLAHRGACGCEANTGDGAGILTQIPDKFLRRECGDLGFQLPEFGRYGVGMAFLPADPYTRFKCEWLLEHVVRQEGQSVLGWRTVPTDDSLIGPTAKATRPIIRQAFIGSTDPECDKESFERKLYVIRKHVENLVGTASEVPPEAFYLCSLSHKTIVYKGMLIADQLTGFYPDLRDEDVESALCLVHSRFSTNTFPSWARAHPYRYLCHNGEINTLRGNINWMHARESMFESRLFGQDIQKILPVIDDTGSDSAMFDNALELLVLGGRSLPHSMMMMIPEPWSGHESMSQEKKDFYQYHSCLMEPWDGPASIAFTDGRVVGAVLDRNGLRPSRYYVTKDDLVIMASEVGVLELAPENIAYKGRLQPGRMLLIDTVENRLISDEELKHEIATGKPYGQWLQDHLVSLDDLPEPKHVPEPDHETVRLRQLAFGYTTEDLKIVMAPMATSGVEAIGSMGNDAALPILSSHSQLLYNYFKQLFAQVTNPPVDAIREELIMSVETTMGPEKNLLRPRPESARQIKLRYPILSNEELEKLRQLRDDRQGNGRREDGLRSFRSTTLSALFEIQEGGDGLERALAELCQATSQAVENGCEIIILSDRGLDRGQAPIPALLAVSGVHHHLIREGNRTRVALVVESGEPREVHHYALLLGYGANAINPYLAFETLSDMVQQGILTGMDYPQSSQNYIKATVKGVVKVMTKMGISTIQSYRGAQIFEAVGLDQKFVDQYFSWTPTRIGGVGIDVIAREVELRHKNAFPDRPVGHQELSEGGHMQWRRHGETHLFDPQTIHKLQCACRTKNYQVFQEYSRLVNGQTKELCTLRGLLEFNVAEKPVPIAEVEPIESIVRRFKTGAMSYGSISQEAHEALAIAMNRIGGKSNTGEGGEDPQRYTPDPNGDSRNSAIKQVASGRFGVTSEYLVNAQELQIKMAQGAKPGEGGQLPGSKVYPWIAQVRLSTPGVGLISPPPHHDIYSIEDLAQLIHDLKNANHQARISVKLVSEVGVGTVAAGVSKAKADVVLISGHDGGTGASPVTSIRHAGIPWELGLAETHQVLVFNDLRSRITVEVDGQLKTGRDVVIGALLGAEEFGFATAPLVVLGCIVMRVCHLNTCPVGVATQDPELRKKFMGDPSHVINFMRFVAQEVRELMAQLGFRRLDEMVGRTDKLRMRSDVKHWKAKTLDFAQILQRPSVPAYVGRFCQIPQDHGLEKALDNTRLLKMCEPALKNAEAVSQTLHIRNTNRATGTILGSEVTRHYGSKGLPDNTIRLHFKGSAGQSFGAFSPRGVTLTLEGDANDYIGKGLSGGKIIVYPSEGSTFLPEENVIVGNVSFYGATGGEVYIRGVAGERFCVRNSGVNAVVEGVGDHGCEYMTGGRVVVLGPTGRNFAAGMSGGIAYVLNEGADFQNHCNLQMVQLFSVEDPKEIELLRTMVRRHAEYTRSQRAWSLLAAWETTVKKIVKVYPKDYRRVLETQERVKAAGYSREEAVMLAFEQNSQDAARIGGN